VKTQNFLAVKKFDRFNRALFNYFDIGNGETTDTRNSSEAYIAASAEIDDPLPKVTLSPETVSRMNQDKQRPIAFSKPAANLGPEDAIIGENIYGKVCSACHMAAFPIFREQTESRKHLEKGLDNLAMITIRGTNVHPQAGALFNLSDNETRDAVYFMALNHK
jgi:cytochrome c5